VRPPAVAAGSQEAARVADPVLALGHGVSVLLDRVAAVDAGRVDEAARTLPDHVGGDPDRLPHESTASTMPSPSGCRNVVYFDNTSPDSA
jgi:hypothetical protein